MPPLGYRLKPVTMSPFNLTDNDWAYIVEGIRDRDCVLCIGPGIYSIDPDKPHFSLQLRDHLRERQDGLRIRVQNNGWFHLQANGSYGPAYKAVRDFYKHIPEGSKEILRKLARIKQHLFLSLNPDDHLRLAFQDQHLPHFYGTYVRNTPAPSYQTPSPEKPLIYNLLGELSQCNSLVLTFDDFYDYLESVFKGNSMSDMLEKTILDAEYFLFIGIPFDQWFVHLFLRILRQHKEKGRTKFAAGRALEPEDLDSCLEQYNIRFVNKGISSFVDELYQQCEHKGLVKSAARSEYKPPEQFEELRNWAGKNDFSQIAQRSKQLLRGTGEAGKPILMQIFELEGRFNLLTESDRSGTVNFENRNVEMNAIRKGFLGVIDELQEFWIK